MIEFTIVFDETTPWTSWKSAKDYCKNELGTNFYAINSDLKQMKVNSLAWDEGLTDRAWVGLYYDGTEWLWSDGSPTLGYSNWLTVPTDPDAFSKVVLLFNKNETDFGKWKARRPSTDGNIIVCKKPSQDVQDMRDFSPKKNKLGVS